MFQSHLALKLPAKLRSGHFAVAYVAPASPVRVVLPESRRRLFGPNSFIRWVVPVLAEGALDYAVGLDIHELHGVPSSQYPLPLPEVQCRIPISFSIRARSSSEYEWGMPSVCLIFSAILSESVCCFWKRMAASSISGLFPGFGALFLNILCPLLLVLVVEQLIQPHGAEEGRFGYGFRESGSSSWAPLFGEPPSIIYHKKIC